MAPSQPLVVGLVNNMPDAALHSTERHFLDLLTAAAGPQEAVKLRIFHIPEVIRGEAGRAHVERNYERLDALWDSPLDGLIVTGSEPRALVLENETYWPGLAALADWVEDRGIPVIWSCLAAQAAVLRQSGVARRPLGRKLSGAFDCVRSGPHRLTAGLPLRWRCPHTRYNDLPEAALLNVGYNVLSRVEGVGVDLFVREGDGLALYMQGHPEYDAKALLREYRRDVSRFLDGARETFPDALTGTFGPAVVAALDACRGRALQTRAPGVLDEVSAILADCTPDRSWLAPAVTLYANWLSHVAARRAARRGLARAHVADSYPGTMEARA